MSSVAPSPTPAGNTGPQSKVIAWTSFVVDTRTSKVYSVANGGHADYAGNEVDELDLERAQPVWTQRLAPTPNNQLTDCQSYYADGRPTSRHTYYGVTLNTFDDRIMLIAGANWCGPGGGHSAMSSYNIGANSYNPSGTHPNRPIGGFGVAHSADPLTGDIYAVGDFVFRKWTRSTNAWSDPSPSGSIPAAVNAMSAIDTTRGRILIVGGGDSAHHLYMISTNTFSAVTLTGSAAVTVQSMVQGALFYVPALDLFFARGDSSGGTVYQIHPTTFEVTQYSTTDGGSIPATQNGPYNKFLYVPRLGGAVYVPSYSGNAWFLRIH